MSFDLVDGVKFCDMDFKSQSCVPETKSVGWLWWSRLLAGKIDRGFPVLQGKVAV